ncbi:unnamed protein product [Sphagnum troendelagicum]|uniref:CSC1-like protein ERD4 n=1 Tax=Sphagnum troendelagicum TaxID=128251 RepID=A0ABP0U548_9BRYO
MVSTGGFVTSLLTSFVVFLILVALFTVLSRMPANYNIYYPARILNGQGVPGGPGKKKPGPFAWIREAYMASEDDILAIAGLDATVYIRFFTTVLEILGFSALICLPLLIPLAVTSHNNADQYAASSNNTYSNIDNLSMSNLPPASMKIWAFFAAAFWVSLVTYYVLLKAYKHILKLRVQHESSQTAEPQQYAALVRDIPKPGAHETRTEQVDTFFRQLHPGTYEKCIIICKLKKALKLYKKLVKARKKLEHAEAVYELSKRKGGEGKRPTNKTGFWGLIGSKVDSIDYYKEQIKELTPKLVVEQKRVQEEEQEGAALVFFNNRRSAAEAAQVRHAKYAMEWQVLPAPEPREVVWSNLAKPVWKRSVTEAIVYIIVIVVILFYMIPIAFVSTLTTLNNLVKLVPFIKAIVKITVLNTVLQAYLPQIALVLFMALLPRLLLVLSTAEGIPSQSQIVRATAGKYFYFEVFNVFLGVTIFGTIFSSLEGIKTLVSTTFSANELVDLFGSKLPPVASYFITYVALRFFIGYGLALSRVLSLTIYHLKRKYVCKTQTELEEAWAPGAFSYHTNIPNDLLIATIALCYSVIAPLVLVFALLYFAIGWVVNRHQALNVQVPDFESEGRMWPHIHNRILAALFVSQLTMLGYFAVKKFPYAPVLIILPVITAAFALLCQKNFYPSFSTVSLAVASQEVKEGPSLPEVLVAFTPACLLGPDQVKDPKYEAADANISSQIDNDIADAV